MKVIVGCPVRGREWILPRFFEALVEASGDLDIRCLFVGSEDDDSTWDAVKRCPFPMIPVFVDEPAGDVPRDWSAPGRIEHMVDLRNTLLRNVRIESPDVFVSLDSDILIQPDALRLGIEALAQYDAVGLGCYMTPLTPAGGSKLFPSNGIFNRNVLRRVEMDPGVHPVDVIMAAKIMSPAAYGVDYAYDHRGEDIGWSIACWQAGLKFGWDNRTISRHVMSESELAFTDPRVR